MEAVQSGHGIIETIEKNLPFAPSQKPRGIGIEAVFDLGRPFNIFDPKK
jgi:hypothetical protein